jgi:cell division protein FtsQ
MPRLKTPAKSSRQAKVQDRLSSRALLLRRIRRGLKPAALIAALLLAVILIPALWSGAVSTVSGPLHRGAERTVARLGFQVRHIEIKGATTTPVSLIRAALGVDKGASIFGFSVAEAAARIGGLGPVRQATVRRVLPATVLVTVTERRPFAIWQAPDKRFVLIDRRGAIMFNHDAAAAKARDPGLLLLAGAGAPQHASALIDRLDRFPAIEERVAAVQRIDDLRWNLIMKNHALIRLPAQHAGAALAELMAIQNRIQILDRPVRIIDLRLAGRLVVRPYPAGFIEGAAPENAAPDAAAPQKTLHAETKKPRLTSRTGNRT